MRKRIKEIGFGSFSIVDQLEQFRTVFLIIDSVLGLLGGISLLVASFGIANTMIMSILERTREIGIMKAIGAEDREIKLIFFVEAAVLGLVGGVVGVLGAWAIDAIANRLAYRFILKPQGASFVDFFSSAAVAQRRRHPVCVDGFNSRSTLSSRRAPRASIRCGRCGMIDQVIGWEPNRLSA